MDIKKSEGHSFFFLVLRHFLSNFIDPTDYPLSEKEFEKEGEKRISGSCINQRILHKPILLF